jgi:hypothetical protein
MSIFCTWILAINKAEASARTHVIDQTQLGAAIFPIGIASGGRRRRPNGGCFAFSFRELRSSRLTTRTVKRQQRHRRRRRGDRGRRRPAWSWRWSWGAWSIRPGRRSSARFRRSGSAMLPTWDEVTCVRAHCRRFSFVPVTRMISRGWKSSHQSYAKYWRLEYSTSSHLTLHIFS